jgi:16S rRNA processing protein RimM
MAENQQKEFRTVGKIKDAHGLKGELYVMLFASEASWVKKLKTLRLLKTEDGGELALELTIKSARVHKGGLIVMTTELADRTAAEKLKGLFLEIPSEFLISKKGEDLYLAEIAGFEVHIKGHPEVGTITGFSGNGAQDLLQVTLPHGMFEIPFVEAFVVEIDHAKKSMTLDLPVGLLGETEEDELQ